MEKEAIVPGRIVRSLLEALNVRVSQQPWRCDLKPGYNHELLSQNK